MQFNYNMCTVFDGAMVEGVERLGSDLIALGSNPRRHGCVVFVFVLVSTIATLSLAQHSVMMMIVKVKLSLIVEMGMGVNRKQTYYIRQILSEIPFRFYLILFSW